MSGKTLKDLSVEKKKYLIITCVAVMFFVFLKSLYGTYVDMQKESQKRKELTKDKQINVNDRSIYDLDQTTALKNAIQDVRLEMDEKLKEQKNTNEQLTKNIEQNQQTIIKQQEEIMTYRRIDNKEELNVNKEVSSELQMLKEKLDENKKELEMIKKEKELNDKLKQAELDLPPLKGPLADVTKPNKSDKTESIDTKLDELKIDKPKDSGFFKLGKDEKEQTSNDESSDKKKQKTKTDKNLSKEEDEIKYGPKMDLMLGLVDATLVMGVDAPTNIGTKNSDAKDPLPVLLSVSSDALIANNYRQDYKNCLILATATGNATTERAYMRLSKLSCVSKNGEKRVEASVEGWVVGEDNKTGVSGNLVTKSGTLILKGLMAGIAQGLAQAASNTNNYISTGSSGYGYNSGGASATSNLAEGFGSGAGSAFKTIADFYIEMAKDLYPVIEVRGGRKVQILVKGTDPKNPIREVPYNKMFINTDYELDVNQNVSIAY